ncbi:MAG: type II TA system antitoxin MqsA family protein [Bacteriovoracia bacterium]
MLCLKCESENFTEKQVKLEQEFKGESLYVVVPANVCDSCGFEQLSDEQANNLRKATADEYRKKHFLLTSGEIRELRESLEMSQSQFSEYLGVGVASIKRWETYFVQEKSQDDLIRMKCDSSWAERNALKVSWAKDRPDVYNGNKKFDLSAFVNLMIKFNDIAQSPLYAFKILFYVDFLHFKKFNKSITGMKYSCLQYGPIPKRYDVLIDYLVSEKIFKRDGVHNLKPNKDFEESCFSTDELAIINQVHDIASKKGYRFFFNKSHKEDAYQESDYLGTLSYEYAKNINL